MYLKCTKSCDKCSSSYEQSQQPKYCSVPELFNLIGTLRAFSADLNDGRLIPRSQDFKFFLLFFFGRKSCLLLMSNNVPLGEN